MQARRTIYLILMTLLMAAVSFKGTPADTMTALAIVHQPTPPATPPASSLTPAVDASLKAQADPLKEAGNQLAQVGDWPGALDKYQLALTLYRRAHDRDGEARALYNLGLVYASDDTKKVLDYQKALDYFQQALAIWRERDDSLWETRALYNLGWVYAQLNDKQKAIDYFNQALTRLAKLGNPLEQGNALVNIAAAYKALGDYEKAVAYYQQALSLFRIEHEAAKTALILQELGSTYQKLGDYTQAIDHLQQARTLFQQLNDLNNQALTEKFIGLLHKSTENNQAALAAYQAALGLWQAVGNKAEAAIIHRLIGDVLTSLGDYHQALVHYDQALSFWQETDVPDRTDEQAQAAEMLDVLGQFYRLLGDYAKAEAYYNQAHVVWHQLKENAREAEALRQIGFSASLLNDYAQAIDYYQQALQLWKAISDRAGEARVLTDIGFAYDWQGEPRQALDFLNQALPLWQAKGDQVEIVRVMSKVSLIYAKLTITQQLQADERLQLSRYLRAAITDNEAVDEPAFKAVLLSRLGLVYSLLGDNQHALDYFKQALTLAKTIKDRPLQATALDNIGLAYEFSGDSDQAIKFYEQAIDVIETLQEHIRVEELKAMFAGDPNQTNIYARLIHLLWQSARTDEAFAYVERARARAFLDQIGNHPIDFRQGAAASLIEQERALRQRLIRLQQELRVKQALPLNEQTPAVAQRQSELEQARRDYADLLTQLKIDNPEYASLVSVDTLNLNEVQATVVPKGATLIEYFVMQEQTLVWVIDQEQVKLISVKLTEKELKSKIEFLYNLLKQQQSADNLDLFMTASARLYEQLFSPLTPYLRHTNLLIIPHGELHYLPFAALWDAQTKHYLTERYTITYAPSASVLKFIHEKQNPNNGKLLALGNSASDLKYVTTEVNAIAKLYQTTPRLNNQATESQVYTQASQIDILHLAAHGLYDPFNPLFTRIELAADQHNDGYLEVHEVYGLDLTNTNLVVLSACETASGQQSKGDEIVGLTRAFLYAGTPSIVTTLWRIDDKVTGELMVAFYKNLRAGQPVAEALRQAQVTVLKQTAWRSPYYWAAFTLHGDGSPVLASR